MLCLRHTLPRPYPISALPLRSHAVIPLVMTGNVVNTAQYASTASIMKYTLANVQQGSGKLWWVLRCCTTYPGWLTHVARLAGSRCRQ